MVIDQYLVAEGLVRTAEVVRHDPIGELAVENGTVRGHVPEGNEFINQGAQLSVVIDSGRGMSPELLQKLFGRFVRDEKTKNEIQGTGLGLYIAKQIVT